MSNSLGKKFEDRFRSGWLKSFPGGFVYRLYDQVSGFKETSRNPCDFFAYTDGLLLMVECKETKEGTFNFSNLRQYDALKSYRGIKGVIPLVLIWFSQKDRILAVTIDEIVRIKEELGEASVSLNRYMKDPTAYNIIDLPVTKQRIFLVADYTYLIDKLKEKENK